MAVENCFRYFGMTDLDAVYSMGYGEYLFRMDMYQKRARDEQEKMLFQAWLTSRVAVAHTIKGHYVYKNYEDFKKIIQSESNHGYDYSHLRKMAILQREFEQKGGNEWNNIQ